MARKWRAVRVAEGARLESVYRLIAYQEFESLALRQIHDVSRNGRYPESPLLSGLFCIHGIYVIPFKTNIRSPLSPAACIKRINDKNHSLLADLPNTQAGVTGNSFWFRLSIPTGITQACPTYLKGNIIAHEKGSQLEVQAMPGILCVLFYSVILTYLSIVLASTIFNGDLQSIFIALVFWVMAALPPYSSFRDQKQQSLKALTKLVQ